MKRTLLAILLIAVSSYAQTPSEQTTGGVNGTVVDGVTSQPLSGASVTIRGPMGSTGGGAWKSNSATSDGDGRFTFSGLAAGRYMISASHTGYVNQGFGGGGFRSRAVVVTPGQSVDDFIVTLTPGGVITGHITDVASKPLAGVTVQILKRRYQAGGPELTEESSTQTNKGGEFRIASLMPGKYYLRAMFSEAQPSKPNSDLAFVPTYYPGAPDQASAVPLMMTPGAELAGIDLTLKQQHTFTIKGHVLDAQSKAPIPDSDLTVAPVEGGAGASPYQATTDAKGNFELRGIPAGEYVVMAQKSSESENSDNKWGRKSISVQDANLNGVEILAARGVEVSGWIQVEGKTSVNLGQMTGTLESTDSGSADSSVDVDNASVKPDGRFAFHDVPEGTYRISFSPIPQGFFIKTESSEGVITVPRGQAVRGLSFVLSSGVARIQGTAMKDQQATVGITVVLVPAAGGRGQPQNFKRATSDPQGKFAMQGVIPGNYEIFAFEQVDRGALMDPDFLTQYEGRGKDLAVKEGDNLSVDLDVIPAE